MKKILTIAIASASVAAFAEFSPTIGVNSLNLTEKNNIIPVQFTSLESDTGAPVKASALVCTNGIPSGSHLYVFQDNAYTGWQLGDNGWIPLTSVSTADGISAGIPATDQTLAMGSAIWLSFSEAANRTVFFYGQVATATNSTIVAQKTNLLCNPTEETVSLSTKLSGMTPAKGDKILPIGNAFDGYFAYDGSKWYKVTKDGYAEKPLPSLVPNQGVWFVSKSEENRVINW